MRKNIIYLFIYLLKLGWDVCLIGTILGGYYKVACMKFELIGYFSQGFGCLLSVFFG